MYCVVCGKLNIGDNHKCSKKGIEHFNRSEGGKNGARKRSHENFRYGNGTNFSGRLSAARALMLDAGQI